MLKVVAAVYLLNFMGVGPTLVPFDSMKACNVARSLILSRAEGQADAFARQYHPRSLICVKTK